MTAAVEYTKKSITLPVKSVEAAEECAPDGNFSAFVAQAVDHEVQRIRLEEFLDEYREKCGRPTSEQVLERAKEMGLWPLP
ncbi:MAG: hypothetical protein LBR21_08180 [Propionibacteriaceae bacterium]|jgi:hypothetical protein|nr:hypothetical protein [Propionibacteriaceae bacterium]